MSHAADKRIESKFVGVLGVENLFTCSNVHQIRNK